MADPRQPGAVVFDPHCPNCGHDNPPSARFCSRCAAPLAQVRRTIGIAPRGSAGGAAACAKCGQRLPAGAGFCSACGSPVGSAGSAGARPDASLQGSLGRLGLQLSRQQITGLILSAVGGMVFARLLPFVYAPIVGPILNILFGRIGGRDTFNVVLMALLTFLFSLGIAFTTMVIGMQRRGA